MHLAGSCHCGAVRFTVQAPHPVPYQLCYCSICRKTAGGTGAAVNLGALAATLDVHGAEHTRTYNAVLRSEGEADVRSDADRVFCALCGSALWLFSPDWPDLLHPFASAIDTALPPAPEESHIMLGSRPSWVRRPTRPQDRSFEAFADESIADWHERVMGGPVTATSAGVGREEG